MVSFYFFFCLFVFNLQCFFTDFLIQCRVFSIFPEKTMLEILPCLQQSKYSPCLLPSFLLENKVVSFLSNKMLMTQENKMSLKDQMWFMSREVRD